MVREKRVGGFVPARGKIIEKRRGDRNGAIRITRLTALRGVADANDVGI